MNPATDDVLQCFLGETQLDPASDFAGFYDAYRKYAQRHGRTCDSQRNVRDSLIFMGKLPNDIPGRRMWWSWDRGS